MFPLVAFALSHGAPDVACAIAFAVCVNVGASLACIAAIKYTVPEDYLPKSLTAWPWEPEAWGLPPHKKEEAPQQAESAEQKPKQQSIQAQETEQRPKTVNEHND